MNNELPVILEDLRKRHNWTKTDVQKKLGINAVSTYANYEYGVRQPNHEMLIKIATLYDVSTDYLLGRTDIEEPLYKKVELNEKNANGKRYVIDLSEANKEDQEKIQKMWELIQKNNKND